MLADRLAERECKLDECDKRFANERVYKKHAKEVHEAVDFDMLDEDIKQRTLLSYMKLFGEILEEEGLQDCLP